ncbi:MAG: hypothetical protein GC192_01060 [Bacteroidetes bacterium]|nr:hypothetical protein [Bacteroidota bacterium]
MHKKMAIWLTRLACTFAALLSFAALSAQDLPLERLSSELGLSQNMITALIQDDKGFIWVGTKDGLNRFDGYHFKVFRYDPFDEKSISDNYIGGIVQDHDGRIWVGTEKGLNLLDPKDETFQRIEFPSQTDGDSSMLKIGRLSVDSKGRIWAPVHQNFLYLLEMPKGKMDVKNLKVNKIDLLEEGETIKGVQGFYAPPVEDETGVFWEFDDDILRRFTLSPDMKANVRTDFPEITDPALRAMLEEGKVKLVVNNGRNGNIIMGVMNKIGWYNPVKKTWKFTSFSYDENIFNYDVWNIAPITEALDGTIWIGSFGFLARLKKGQSDLEIFHSRTNVEYPFYYGVSGVLEDKGGIFWMGTRGNGLMKYNPDAQRFAQKIGSKTASFRWQGASLRGLFQSSDGLIWAGMVEGKMLMIDQTGISHLVDVDETFFSIAQDQQGGIWMGTTNYLRKVKSWTLGQIEWEKTIQLSADTSISKSNTVWKVLPGRDGKIWALTLDALCSYDPATGKLEGFPYLLGNQKENLANDYPTLFEDEAGIIWLGTAMGLGRFDPKKKRLRYFQNNPKNPESISSNKVKAIAADPDDPGRYLWIGTAGGGLNCFDIQKETFEKFTEKDGLPDMVIYALLPDGAGNLWMSTNLGLSAFNTKARTFRNFDEKDGLQNLEFNSGSYYRGKDGRLFFGGIKGLNGFFPKEMLTANKHVPSVVFTDFKIANKSVSPHDEASPLKSSIIYTKEITLPYTVKIMSFEFAALDFSAPRKNQFACKMEGFDADWQQLGTSNTVTYTNLDPGTYTLRVKASNNDGVWNEEGASIVITIRPPWWATWWAWVLYSTLVAGVIFLMYRLQTARHMEHLEAQRLKELNEAKSTFLSTVSHELRTPLTSILGFSKIIQKRLEERILPHTDQSDPKTEKAVHQVRENLGIVLTEGERLTALINEVLDLAKIESGNIVWNKDEVSIPDVIERATAATEALFLQKGLELVKRVEPNLPVIIADRDRLIQVVVNLLSNAVKFTEAGKITVATHLLEKEIIVSISDSGVGISKENQSLVFEKFKQIGDDTLTDKPKGTGLGLPICKEIVEHYGGRIWLESEFGQGSTFSFTLPV